MITKSCRQKKCMVCVDPRCECECHEWDKENINYKKVEE